MILELLQYDFFRKGLEIPSFLGNFRYLIEKDWNESSEIYNQLQNISNSNSKNEIEKDNLEIN